MKKVSIKHLFSRKNAFLRTMLLTTVVLICIPLIATQLVMINQTTREFQNNTERSYLSALQTNANAFQTQLMMFSDTALQMSLDTTISSPLRVKKQSVYTQLNTITKIDDYKTSTPYASDIAIYYKSEGYVLSSSCKRLLTVFCSHAVSSNDAYTLQLHSFLETLNTADIFPVVGDYLIYAKPVSILSALDQNAVVCFLIDADRFASIFEASIPYNASFGITGSTGELILSGTNFPDKLVANSNFQAYLKDPETVCYDASIDAVEMHIYKYIDPQSGNIFLASVNKNASDKALTTYVNRIHVIVAFAFVFMFMMLAVTVYINYRPVKKLITRHAPEHTDSDLSELELLDSVFFAKDERIANQRNLLSAFLLGDFLFGTEVDQELLKQHFPASKYKYFAVAAVSRVQLTSAQANKVVELLREALSSCEVHTTSMPNSPRSLFIFMSGEPLDSALLKEKLMLNVRRIAGEDGEVQVGDVVNQIQQLQHSHQTALAGKMAIAQTETLPNENPQLAKDTQLFIQYVCTGNQKNALAALERMEGTIASSAVKPIHRNYYCYKLLFAYLSSANENSITLTAEEMEHLLAFQNPVQLFALLRQSVILYCSRVRADAQNSNAQIQSKLLQYVNDNLTSSELCLTSAADYLNLSIYAVSRLFKEYTQQNFKEYITGKRLEMAFDLLCSTDQNISEIANSVGFEDASYFSEVFKKHYGVVPTKMRSNAEKEKKK